MIETGWVIFYEGIGLPRLEFVLRHSLITFRYLILRALLSTTIIWSSHKIRPNFELAILPNAAEIFAKLSLVTEQNSFLTVQLQRVDDIWRRKMNKTAFIHSPGYYQCAGTGPMIE